MSKLAILCLLSDTQILFDDYQQIAIMDALVPYVVSTVASLFERFDQTRAARRNHNEQSSVLYFQRIFTGTGRVAMGVTLENLYQLSSHDTHLGERDHHLLAQRRSYYSKFGYPVQLCTDRSLEHC